MSDDKPELVTVDLKKVVAGNKVNYMKFLARTQHAPTMVRNSMMLAYEQALNEVNQLLDDSKVSIDAG